MKDEQIDAVARRVVEILRAEREGAVRAALRGLAARIADIEAHAASAQEHLDCLRETGM
ncbi:MAG: hypothetical protein ACOYM5_02865 [Caulobacter sp.]